MWKDNPGQARAQEETLGSKARFCLLYGGSRSGKTAKIIETIITRANAAPGSRHLIARQDATSVRKAIVEDTFPKTWSLAYPGVPIPTWKDQLGYYTFANGSQVWIGGLNDERAKERILGNEYASIYVNEASQVTYSGFLLLRTRLAQVVSCTDGVPLTQRFYVDLNPTTRIHWTYRLWVDGVEPQDEQPVDRSQYAFTQINPYDNRENLSADTLADLEALPAREKKRFLLGEYSADDENAIWRREFIKRSSMTEDGNWPVQMRRIVVAIDPAVTNTPGSDETGIIAVGLGSDGNGYILSDDSGRYRPEEWALRAISVYESLDADSIVAEVNNGGDMVEHTIRAQAPEIPVKMVRASKGKFTRATPVAGLYERGKMFHVGEFRDLEDQMCAFTVGFDSKVTGWSPDRVDALVWGVTELFPSIAARKSVGLIPAQKFSRV